MLVPSLDASSEPLTEPELDYCFTLLKSGSVDLANLSSRVANTIKVLTHRAIEGKAPILYLLDQQSPTVTQKSLLQLMYRCQSLFRMTADATKVLRTYH